MPLVTLRDVDADQIADAVQEGCDLGKAVFVEALDAPVLDRDALVIRRADERPVSTAPVEDDAEILVDVRARQSGFGKHDVMLDRIVNGCDHDRATVKADRCQHRLVCLHLCLDSLDIGVVDGGHGRGSFL